MVNFLFELSLIPESVFMQIFDINEYLMTFWSDLNNYNLLVSNVEWFLCLQCLNEG